MSASPSASQSQASHFLAPPLHPLPPMVTLASQSRNLFSAQAGVQGSSREELLAAITELVDAAVIAGCEIPHLHVWFGRDFTARVMGRIPE